MKELSRTQVQQVSGGFNIGSFMSYVGLKQMGSLVHTVEKGIYGITVGLIPVLGAAAKNFLTDAFGQFQKPSTETPAETPAETPEV